MMFSLQRNLHTRPFMYPNNNASLRRQCFAALITAVLSIPAYANLRAHAPYEPDTPWVLHEAVNLFKNATVKASSHVGHKKAELAIDGHRENKNQYWETRGEQASLTIDMGQGQPINTIRLWTAWDKSRVHKYLIEGSADGAAWHLLADQRDNTMPATDLGRTFYFPTRTLRYIRTTFVRPDDEQEATGQIVEIAGYRLDDARIQQLLKWNDVPAGLQGAVGTIDVRYPRDFVPELDRQDTCRLVAWRGERVHAQLVLWTATGIRQVRLIHSAPRTADGREMPADAVRTRFVRYVLADGRLCADVLDTADRLDLPPQTVRPVWVSIDVPRDASPGLYTTQIRIEGADVKPLVFPVRIEVLTPVLPEPAQWSFHLDLWQNPWAVARYHHVPPFSPEHYMLMEPLLRMLAEAGQKCLTVSIVDAPWGGQTYDTFGTMIQWIRTEDGTWRYDYRLFDEWVRFGQACGIRDQINCYSMVPWTNRFRYFDEASGDYRWVEAEPGTEAYETHWRPFLVDFVALAAFPGRFRRTSPTLRLAGPHGHRPGRTQPGTSPKAAGLRETSRAGPENRLGRQISSGDEIRHLRPVPVHRPSDRPRRDRGARRAWAPHDVLRMLRARAAQHLPHLPTSRIRMARLVRRRPRLYWLFTMGVQQLGGRPLVRHQLRNVARRRLLSRLSRPP